MEVVGQINRIAAALELAVEPIYADAGVSATEVQLLVPLRYSTEQTAIRIAEQLGMTRAGVSKALSGLERRGFVERISNPSDRRSAFVRLTDSGRAVIDEVFPKEIRAHAVLLEALGGERRRILSSLNLLADAVDADTAR
ncbi:hypothetical protein CH299_12835 [Rhodococcus sp. 14-2686-1-2]|nr:hypothetical protein CH301_12155 [Rhodococcus sp. 15-1189-1-1a]OZF14465.1 hypothetical protein CH299_12835 [Rhodococcus sp. 14-2686-1-2]